MDFSLTAEQSKKIETIHRLFLDLEKEATETSSFDPLLLEDLIRLVQALEKEDSVLLKKLATTASHLKPEMSLRHFVALAIPFERALKRNIQDDDFLVTSTDLKDSSSIQKAPLYFILENIRSAFNVGAFFRTSECLGAKALYLTGYTSSPLNLKVEKTSMGTAQFIEWEHRSSTLDTIQELRSQGVRICAVETSLQAQIYSQDFFKTPYAFVFGNERFGLEQDILKACDEVRRIPVFGAKNSLNVCIAAGVIGFEWRRQYGLR